MAGKRFDKGVTLIATGTEVVGDIKFADQLFISGKVSGTVIADHEKAILTISEGGRMEGEVRVPNVVINGTVEGSVFASHKIELAPLAKVQGNLHYKEIVMQLGAMVDGQLVHETPDAGDNVHALKVDNANNHPD